MVQPVTLKSDERSEAPALVAISRLIMKPAICRIFRHWPKSQMIMAVICFVTVRNPQENATADADMIMVIAAHKFGGLQRGWRVADQG
jgi:hypothetical protein